MNHPDDDMAPELSPPGESSFAVDHGLVGTTPDVAVVGSAVRQGREAAGLTTEVVAAAMSQRGYGVDAAALAALEDGSVQRLPARSARLLAALVDLPLEAIEAVADPWPADPAGLTSLRHAGIEPVALGGDVVVRTAAGSYLGLLRCTGDASVLDSRTYRTAAATRLTGGWSHLAGALLVTRDPPHAALAVDALDCVSRAHAPSGLSGFSRLPTPEPVAEALASYDRLYAVRWSDPLRLATGDRGSSGKGAPAVPAELARELRAEARRSRQPGKRAGYERAAAWLETVPPSALNRVLGALADPDLPADDAQARLDQVLGP